MNTFIHQDGGSNDGSAAHNDASGTNKDVDGHHPSHGEKCTTGQLVSATPGHIDLLMARANSSNPEIAYTAIAELNTIAISLRMCPDQYSDNDDLANAIKLVLDKLQRGEEIIIRFGIPVMSGA